MSLRIEFIGLPGSGKTTLRNRLLSDPNINDNVVLESAEQVFVRVAKNRAERSVRIPLKLLAGRAALGFAARYASRSQLRFEAQARFLARYGESLSAFLSSLCFDSMTELNRQRVIGSYLELGALWECLAGEADEGRAILFEEGLVQKSMMFVDHLGCDVREVAAIEQYLRAIPAADLVIYVKTSADTSLHRMLARPDGLTDRLRELDEPSIGEFLSRAEEHMALVCSWLRESRSGSVIEYDAEDSAADRYVDVLDALKDLLGRG